MARNSARIALAAALAALIMAGCATTEKAPAPAAVSVPENDLLNATLWMQSSVEYKATTLGIYALARYRLDEALADKKWTAAPDKQKENYRKLPPAIIFDADETVFDNSKFQAEQIRQRFEYSEERWVEYVNAEVTDAIPGAVEFTNYAKSRGVAVFYVTNRSAATENATRADLAELGFPLKDGEDTVLTKNERPEWTSKKGTRVASVADKYRVLLLLGDNMGDFTDDYYGTPEKRLEVYEANKARWGKEWIALPNPAYGSWESAPFEGNFKLTPDERRQKKLDALEGWEGQR
ncbi:MAG: HAD family acid phosphatase [Parvularculaceae bacterium]